MQTHCCYRPASCVHLRNQWSALVHLESGGAPWFPVGKGDKPANPSASVAPDHKRPDFTLLTAFVLVLVSGARRDAWWGDPFAKDCAPRRGKRGACFSARLS